MPTITLTSGTSWLVPDDWSGANTISCTGPGTSGSNGSTINLPQGGELFFSGYGGAGGAWAQNSNVSLMVGSYVTIQIGTVDSGNDTWFSSTSTLRGQAANGQAPGSASNSVGALVYSGAAGGAQAGSPYYTQYGGGGGGSGSSAGNGSAGGSGASGGAAGSPGGGAGGAPGGAGSAANGYGAGGGGGGAGAGSIGGQGGGGVIVIIYTSSVTPGSAERRIQMAVC